MGLACAKRIHGHVGRLARVGLERLDHIRLSGIGTSIACWRNNFIRHQQKKIKPETFFLLLYLAPLELCARSCILIALQRSSVRIEYRQSCLTERERERRKKEKGDALVAKHFSWYAPRDGDEGLRRVTS